MNATGNLAKPTGGGAVAPREAAPLGRVELPATGRALARRLDGAWIQRASWTIGRTGRPGLVGIALLLASALFLFSTHLGVSAEVESLRADLAAAQLRPLAPAAEPVAAPVSALRALPARSEMPAILGQLYREASRARLAVDSAKYETSVMAGSGVVRHQIAFPVTGPYTQIRAFVDAALATMPEVALSDLQLERKAIGDGSVEAQLRFTVYTRSDP